MGENDKMLLKDAARRRIKCATPSGLKAIETKRLWGGGYVRKCDSVREIYSKDVTFKPSR